MTIRVLLVTPDYPAVDGRSAGGVGSACRNLLHALERLPHIKPCVLVASAPSGPESVGEAVQRSQCHKVLRIPSRQHWCPAVDFMWRHLRMVSEAIRATPHDVLHVQGMDRLAGWHAHPRTILTLHGIIERDAYFRGNICTRRARLALMGWLCRRARRAVPNLVATSRYNRDFIGSSTRGQRVWDIPNAVGESCFAARRDPEMGRVLMAGRVIPRKNVHGAVRAFALTARTNPAAVLRIAGDGDAGYVNMCARLASTLGVGGRVAFLGGLTFEELQREMERCHCLLHSALQETAPLVFSEAMAMGVPIVAPDVGGTRFMVMAGDTGIVVPSTDPACLAEHLSQMLRSLERAAEMGARAREVAASTYHPAIVGRCTAEVYREVMDRAP